MHPESRTRNPDALSKIATRKRELKDVLEKLLSKFNATNKGVMFNSLHVFECDMCSIVTERYIEFRRWQKDFDKQHKQSKVC